MNLNKRLEILERYAGSVFEGPDVIYVNDSDMAVTGFTLCFAGAGGLFVGRNHGESLKDLQDRCQKLDMDYRRDNPINIQAPSVAFAENILTQQQGER